MDLSFLFLLFFTARWYHMITWCLCNLPSGHAEIYPKETLFWGIADQRQLEFLLAIAAKATHTWHIFLNGNYNDFLEKIFSLPCDRQRYGWGGKRCPSETSYHVEVVIVEVINYIYIMKSLSTTVQQDKDNITNVCGPQLLMWIWAELSTRAFWMFSISQGNALYVIKKQELLAFRSNSFSLQFFYHIQKYFTLLRKLYCHSEKQLFVLYLDIMNLGCSVLIQRNTAVVNVCMF